MFGKSEWEKNNLRKNIVYLMQFIFTSSVYEKKNKTIEPIAIKSTEIMQIFVVLMDSYAGANCFLLQ